MRRPKRWQVGVVAGLAIAAAGFASCARDPDRDLTFLENRSPVDNYIIPDFKGEIDIEFSWNYQGRTACRVYSWREPARRVLSQASRDFLKLGFRDVDESDGVSTWEIRNGLSVDIASGKYHSSNGLFGGTVTKDPKWVTVIVREPAPETWLTRLAVALHLSKG